MNKVPINDPKHWRERAEEAHTARRKAAESAVLARADEVIE
jgi:hypothetical protein